MSGGNEGTDPHPGNHPNFSWPWQPRADMRAGRPRRQFRFSLAALFVVVTGAAIGVCCCGVLVRRVNEKGLTADEANRRLEYVHCPRLVPRGATSVDVEASYNGAYVSFNFSLSEYQNLCRERGWDLRRFEVPPDSQPSCTRARDFTLTIRRGYFSDNSTHRGGFDTWYDLDRSRAWIAFAKR
jgi:hypothetical protein